jgi:predicted DsbA family dithiol-disulfide isomerase
LWEQPLDYVSTRRSRRARSLAPFLVTHAAESQQTPAKLARFRLAVFNAFHNERADMSNPDILFDLAGQSGLNADDLRATWQLAEARDRLRHDIEQGFAAGAFGVPTLIINGCEATYLRLSEYPADAAERQALFDDLVNALTQRPYLQELKRASAA